MNPRERLLADPALAQAVEAMTDLSGPDLTSLLIEVFDRRAADVRPVDVLARHEDDRFARIGAVPLASLRAVETAMLEALEPDVELLALAPLVPLGSHRVAGVAQSRLVSTIRRTEVAADPTMGLALEAAVRRRAMSGSTDVVRLATVQRVTRAQQFDGPMSWAHFGLFGHVTAGRDVGGHEFERHAFVDHLEAMVRGVRGVGVERIEIEVTDLSGAIDGMLETITERLAADDVEVRDDPDRSAGRSYYEHLCFKVHVVREGRRFEVGDGGLTDWTRTFIGDRRERMMTSGAGLERLAATN